MIRSAMLIRALAVFGLSLFLSSAFAEVRTFDLPQYQGSMLAYCSADRSLCGEELANAWCVNEGYDRASNWLLADNTGVVSPPTNRQPAGSGFRSITCSRAESNFVAPTLGSFARSTVIAPNRRAAESAISLVAYQVSVPGCTQREPGIFLCESVHDYQHCRALFASGRVFGCRAGVAFASGFAKPQPAVEGSFKLDIESSAIATVRRDQRGKGRLRGRAEFELDLNEPVLEEGRVCLQRDRYLYHPNGPMGGMSDIDSTDSCDRTIRASFEPNQDDLLHAYDMCNSMGAWGAQIEQPIEILVAGLFHVVNSNWAETVKGGMLPPDIVAPYLTVRAPMRVNCEQ